MTVPPSARQRAIRNLSDFLMSAAAATRTVMGFGWLEATNAPSTYPDLTAAVTHSLQTGAPLPVSDSFLDSVIYAHPEVNIALRFWHDVSHVTRGLSFVAIDELQLAGAHLDALQQAGFDRQTLEWQLLHADLTGQVYLQAVGRRFPVDQSSFVAQCLRDGIDTAVLAECGSTRLDQPRLQLANT